jgi:ribose 5-phosphate isomerase
VQIGELEEAVGLGSGLTVTLVVAELEQPLTSVTVTVYVPEAAVEALGIEGFCEVAENPLGPDQE